MGLISYVKGVLGRMFKSDVKKVFGVNCITSGNMQESIGNWLRIYQGFPDWIDEDDNIGTINMAASVCEETARLTNLDLHISFDGGTRAKYMQKWCDDTVMPNIREWVEYGCAAGTIILKPNGKGVDFVLPGSFEIVGIDGNGKISGIVFQDTYENNEMYFTKLEYHRFNTMSVRMPDSDKYVNTTYYTISNKAYVSKNKGELGTPTNLINTKWSTLRPEVYITKKNGEQIESMLFGMIRMPGANKIDIGSPFGMSVFSRALEELKDLDIAYCRNSGEIKDSQKIVLMDERLSQLPSTREANGTIIRNSVKLPHFVKNVNADDKDSFYQEIVPTLQTDTRITGINNKLSQIGFKCGYSNGYFVLDEKTGMITAKQVESDDRRTIQLIKDIRDALQTCLDDVFYAQSVFADLYNLTPVGDYEANYSFGDIIYNHEENLITMKSDAQSGIIPKWMYVMEQYKMSKEEAIALVEEAKGENKADSKLFGEE